MASEFDIASIVWQKHGVLLSPNGAVIVPIVLDETAHSIVAASGTAQYILNAGTPIAKISGGTSYKAVARDTIASSAYTSANTTTTVTVDNSTAAFRVGDVLKACTAVDDAGTSLGAVESIPTSTTITFDADQTGNMDDGDRLTLTETDIRDANGEPGALILIAPVDVYDRDQRAAVDTGFAALVTGVIDGSKILGPLANADTQLIADITGYIIPWVA